jgi:hypothetical protein
VRLHEWFYDLICRICYDREYLFLSFTRHFATFTSALWREGTCVPTGTYAIPGMKSGLEARLTWRLDRRLDWIGSNRLRIECEIVTTDSGERQGYERHAFELATGESNEGGGL